MPIDTNADAAPFPEMPRDLVASLPETLFLVGPDGCIEYISPMWEVVSGFSVAETVGQHAIDFVDPRDRAALAAVFDRVWEQKDQRLRYQARALTRHRRDVWLEARVQLVTRSDGSRVITGLMRDVSAEIGAAGMSLGMADLRFILDSLPGMSFVTDEAGRLVHMSIASQRMFGGDLTSVAGGHWHALVHPDDLERIRERSREWLSERAPFSASMRLRSLDGSWRSVQVLGVPRLADDGTFRGHLGFVQDETANRTAEEKVALHNRLFAMLLDALVVSVFVADADGAVLMANAAGRVMLERLHGRGIQLSARDGLVKILRDDGTVMPEEEWPFVRVRRTGQPELQRVLGVRYMDGDEQWFVVSYQMVPPSQGAWPDGAVMSSWEDITPIRSAAKELRVANEALSRSARMKDEFMASMSHELRTPLNAVLGLSEAMLDGVFGEVTERQVEALRDVAMSGRHLLDLINDILDLSKVAAGKLEPDYDWTDLREACAAAIRMVQPTTMAKRQKLTLEISSGETVRFTDPRWLRQIVTNLLSNAVKFTPAQGEVRVIVELSARHATILVSDNGIGIDAEEQRRIFEPFVQIRQGLNRPQGGTGLGLALVRALCERLGGSVTLESAPGQGATFRVTLPLEPQSTYDGDSGEPIREPRSLDLPEGIADRRVLLAEDNEANIRTFIAYLQSKGYRVDVARNGQLALEMLETHEYDIILMDVQMPVMDGLTATAHIRANPKLAALPIIALTAFAMPGDRERCLAAGANEHLAKPVRLKKLVATIEALCEASAG